MDNNLTFSKIVATPTLNSWSQAYNAGKLFAVISLEKTTELPEIDSLNILGKDLLERLEQEFFTIEEKNLESIKKAISTAFANIVQGVSVSLAAGALVNNILYLFGLGNSKVFIKRNGILGIALNAENITAKNITSSSGFLKERDLIVLTTEAFSQVISRENLDASLNDNDPSEITEALAPKIHESENGKISAIVIKYNNPQIIKETIETEETKEDEGLFADLSSETLAREEAFGEEEPLAPEKRTSSPIYKFLSYIKSKARRPNLKIKITRKLFLILAIAIMAILIISISWAVQEQKNAKARALFSQVYPEAQKKYEEGLSLTDLNKNFATESFQAAQKILNDNKGQFPPESKEAAQTQDLLKKILEGLAQVSPIDKSGLDRSKLSITVNNGSGVEGTAGKAAAVLKEFGYNVLSTGNADNFSYKGVTIKIKKDKEAFINLLKQDLAKEYTITASSSDLPSDSSASAIITIGK